MNTQADIVEQRIHAKDIVLHLREGNKHLREPIEILRKCHCAEGSKRASSWVGVLVWILVLISDARSPRTLVSHEQSGAAISIARLISVRVKAGETQGGQSECVLGIPGCGRVDLQSGGPAEHSPAISTGIDDIGLGRNVEVFHWGIFLRCDCKA